MSSSAELSVIIDNRVADLAELALKVEQLMQGCGVPETTILPIVLALEELVTNTIKYGHSDGLTHPIHVSISVAGGEIMLAIEDDAAPFDPFARPPVDTEAALDDRVPGGLGIHLVKEMIERVDYSRVDGHNRVTIFQPFTAVGKSDDVNKENSI